MSGGRRLRKERCQKEHCPGADQCEHVRKAKDRILELTRENHTFRDRALVESERRSNVEQQLLVDPLTGASNRSGLEKKFQDECAKIKGFEDKRLFMLFMDIDFFGRFNTEHGEHTGDLVLQEFVRTIERNLRQCDSIHRIGGEEFVVLLPEMEGKEDETGNKALDNVCRAADRIRKCIEELRVTAHDDSTLLGVTVSIGIARYGRDDSLDMLIDKANKAELQSKRTGRNRCCLYLGGEVLAVENLLKTT